MNTHHLSDIDLVWIASDDVGNVAAFITAGQGFVPSHLLSFPNDAIEEIERVLNNQPVVSSASLHVLVPRPDDFIAFAERGFFVYDWTDVARISSDEIGGYELVASPKKPIHASQLTGTLKAFVDALQLKNKLFTRDLIVRDQEDNASGKLVETGRPT